MNKEDLTLIKDFITRVLSDDNGIAVQSYAPLSTLMQSSREFAMEMHDVLDRVAIRDGRCILLGEADMAELDGYEL